MLRRQLVPFQPFVEIIRQLIAELKLQERREVTAPDADLTGTHVAGLPADSLVRLLGIVNEYRGELLRIAPQFRSICRARLTSRSISAARPITSTAP